MWMFFSQLLPGILTAGAITGVILFVAARMSPQSRGGWWTGATALGFGYAGGQAVAIGGWPPFPPIDAVHWLVYFSLAGVVFGWIEGPFFHIARTIRLGLFALISAGLLVALLRSKFTYGWSLHQGLAWITILLLILLLVAWSLSRLTRNPKLRAETFPLIIALLATGSGVALLFSGSILLAQLAMILATVTVLWGVAVWRMGMVWSENGLVAVFTWLLAGLWSCGYFFADLPAFSALLFAFAPMAAAAAVAAVGFSKASFFSSNPNPWIAPGVTALITLIAVVIAIRAAVPMDAGY